MATLQSPTHFPSSSPYFLHHALGPIFFYPKYDAALSSMDTIALIALHTPFDCDPKLTPVPLNSDLTVSALALGSIITRVLVY